MPKGLPKQAIPLNFAKGVNTKTDRKQVQLGNFLALENSVFDTEGLLKKRNGYGALTSLPDATSNFITTFNGNLTAIGNSLLALAEGAAQWVNKGGLQPVELDTLALIRSNTNQSQSDTAVSSNGLVCTVFTDVQTAGTVYRYAVADATTGQNIVAPTVIPVSSGTVTGAPKVFALARYFIVVFTNVITATNHLQYIAISISNPSSVTTNADISATYTPATTVNFDGVVANDTLYLAWNGSDGGGAIRMAYLSSTLIVSTAKIFAGRVATIMSVCADNTGSTPIIYAAFYDLASTTAYALAVNQQLDTVKTPTQFLAAGTILNVTSVAQSGLCTIFYEVSNNYGYGTTAATHYIASKTMTQAGTVSSQVTTARSVGLASKAFLIDTSIYLLSIYYSPSQPSYFLLNSSGQVVAKVAYQNGGTYYVTGLPSVAVSDNVAQVSYLIKDLVQAVNKTQGAASATAVYSQTGINLVSFTIGTDKVGVAEIGQNLNLTGGFLWGYDGYAPVENGFHLYPDQVETTTATTGGLMTAQIYYYVATYEWADNQGNVYRSAGSIPVIRNISGSGTATNTITVNVPTLRLTYKTANPVKIVLYRWSTAQQTYYQATSLTAPTMNSLTVDSVAIVDTLADSSIIGNNILYTTGGVIENTGAPSFNAVTLFDDRLWGIDAEDPNLLWYSKQVIETTPVEMSDLLTLYIAPSIGSQGSTGRNKCAAPMDDKLVLFKRNAISYINGTGPDNTGANSQYSQPIFVTSTVGTENQNSIVFQPGGLMFQSDKGIWLLGRDLSTSYIGAPVEAYTKNATVQSAVNVPGTNQIRFTMDSGITLMYDYYYGQWGTFVNVPAISSTLYENLHTYINASGQVYQETPDSYLDGTSPVLMKFTTSWIAPAGVQGYQRAYFYYLLGDYISPHKLIVSTAFDYNNSFIQSKTITPDNSSQAWGGDSSWGEGASWGNTGDDEEWKVFLNQQRCKAFNITVQEIFDPTMGQMAGAGFTLSGINMVVGLKRGFNPIRAARSV